jgi:UDP-N-acetylglucosamine acyltransferase
MLDIHPTAVVSTRAKLGCDISIGPFCVVEADAEIGDRCSLAARAVVKSGCTLGTNNEVGEGAVLGGRPQHLASRGEVGRVVIGNDNVIRENSTVHCAMSPGHETRLGDGCFLMVNAHVAHDCRLGNHVVITNNCMLGGHVEVGDRAYVGGAVGIHQFCRVGRLVMLGGCAIVTQDVPPYVLVDGKSNLIVGLNLIGLRRSGMPAEEMQQLKQAYRLIYRSGLKWSDTLDALSAQFPSGPAAEFHPFLTASKRGVVQERRVPRSATVTLPQTVSPDSPDDRSRRAG